MLLWAFRKVGSFRACTTGMLRGQAKVDPRQGFSGSDSQDKSKPETELKNGNHFAIRRCDGRSFCGRSSDTNLAVREQQQKAKHRQAFLGVGITSSKPGSVTNSGRFDSVGVVLSSLTLELSAPRRNRNKTSNQTNQGCLKFESIANHLRIRSVLCTRNSKMTTIRRQSGSSGTMEPGRSSTMRAAP